MRRIARVWWRNSNESGRRMDDQSHQRRGASKDFILDAETAHVWTIRLDVPLAGMDERALTLSPQEWQRAESFHFDVDRFRFIAGRGALRTILSRYLNEDPAAIEFEYESRGKLRLGGLFAECDLQFNLAHCEDLAVLAVARGRLVGVDLEREREIADMEQVVAMICSPRQIAEFRGLRNEERTVAFYRIWTRKEAWLKATGNGITTSLEEIEPSFGADDPPRYKRVSAESPIPAHVWKLYSFVPRQGFIAALALSADAQSVVHQTWTESCADKIAYV